MRPLPLLLLLYPLLASASLSLVDFLSSSPDHSLLLSAFQRARLIPILNRLNGSTLFAPTNEAIRREQQKEKERGSSAVISSESTRGGVWSLLGVEGDSLDGRKDHDNLQLELRATLLYHCLNYTLFPPPPSTNSSNLTQTLSHRLPLNEVTLQETLLYPVLNKYNHSFPSPPTLPGSEPDKPDPGAPTDHPIGLLDGEGQKVRILRRGKKEISVGVDWKGEGGIEVDQKIQFAKNGGFVSIDGVLERPRDLASIISSLPSLSTFHSLLPPSLFSYLAQTSHLTLFAPTNEAWSSLSELEMRYLRSQFAEMDIEEILGDAASRDSEGKKGSVGYLERLVGKWSSEGESLVKTLRNGTIEVQADGEQVKVNGSTLETGDILAKNGVLHTVPSLLLPSGSLSLTAEKYLIALNCTEFVSMLRSVNLSHYVQVPSSQQGPEIDPNPLPHYSSQLPLASSSRFEDSEETGYTILALKDSILSSPLLTQSLYSISSIPSPGSNELKQLLSYHILPGKWTPQELTDGMLVGTELRTRELTEDRQRLLVSVQDEEGGEGEGWEKTKGKKGEEKEMVIGWGNANTIAEPVEVGNSIIYLISTPLEPPSPVITTAVSDLRLSTFIASLYAATLDGLVATKPSITYLVPTNQAFETLGLVMSYLLLPTAREELKTTIKYHAIDQVVYLEGFPSNSTSPGQTSERYPTLSDGSEIYLERITTKNSSDLFIRGPTLEGLPANGELRSAKLISGNLLTETGVMHVIDQVELPPALEITVDKLLKGARSTTMVQLIREANMSWVLDGTPPPPDPADSQDSNTRSRSKEPTNIARAYTILCPTDKALSRLNLTYYLSHPSALSALVSLHIIPLPSSSSLSPSLLPGAPLPLSDSITYSTLHSRSEGGSSKYGRIGFKKWGEEGGGSWMVGIQGARGTNGESDSARVISWGRATPWFVHEHKNVGRREGGGVVLIDSVLLPYEPGWFRRWGWIALVVVGAAVVIVGLGVWGVRRWRARSKGDGYEPVEGEED